MSLSLSSRYSAPTFLSIVEKSAFAVAQYPCALATLTPWELAAYRAMPLYSASATCSR